MSATIDQLTLRARHRDETLHTPQLLDIIAHLHTQHRPDELALTNAQGILALRVARHTGVRRLSRPELDAAVTALTHFDITSGDLHDRLLHEVERRNNK